MEFRPVDFLREVRRITQENGTALIFDEVIAGFRTHPNGTQALFGIQADIGTYGKVIGGGMPVGAMIGKASGWTPSTAATGSTVMTVFRPRV
ncbi:MAG: aminotransferase class III-fold pyridoxal phosphate-dependent enzyme [Flavobacteriales bacterium]